MAPEIPEACKQYVIKRIINPGVYWMIKAQNGMICKREIQQVENLLRKNVEKIANAEKISIGKIIAVKDEAGFHRGIVTDVFKRNCRKVYLVFLTDHGDMMEANDGKIYWIKNKELMRKKAGAIKVSIKDIQPVALDLKRDTDFLNGLFQPRVQNNWSACAYKYVQKLFENNSCVFVKSLHANDSTVFGEIYFRQESDKVLVSLGQKLCDNGFAVFSQNNSDLQGDDNLSIERKIPEGALFTEVEPKATSKSITKSSKDSDISERVTSTHLDNTVIDLHSQQIKEYREFEKECIALLIKTKENRKSNLSTPLKANSKIHGFPWVSRENFLNSSSYSSVNAFNKCNAIKMEETLPNSILDNSKISIFRIMKRSLELYEKQKQELRGHCHK